MDENMLSGKDLTLPLVTPKTIRDTVLYDSQTYLWAQKLFTVPAVVQRVTGSSENAAKLYGRYCGFFRGMIAAATLGMFLCALGMFFRSVPPSVWVIGAVTMAAIAVVCMSLARRPLADVMARLIELDAHEIPEGATLYQLGEIYARKYGIPSFVDMIWRWNCWLRNAFLASYLATFGVFFLSFPKMIFWTTAACFAAVVGVWAGTMIYGKAFYPARR
jgi:hypothetical protein